MHKQHRFSFISKYLHISSAILVLPIPGLPVSNNNVSVLLMWLTISSFSVLSMYSRDNGELTENLSYRFIKSSISLIWFVSIGTCK